MEDRKFDINYNIEASLLAINKWFEDKSEIQKIRFDTKCGNFQIERSTRQIKPGFGIGEKFLEIFAAGLCSLQFSRSFEFEHFKANF